MTRVIVLLMTDTDRFPRPTHPATVRRLETFERLTWDRFLQEFHSGDAFQADRSLQALVATR
jgi:hypothetical protein